MRAFVGEICILLMFGRWVGLLLFCGLSLLVPKFNFCGVGRVSDGFVNGLVVMVVF